MRRESWHTDTSRQANFGGIIEDIKVLGFDGEVSYERREEGLMIHAKVESSKPVVFKIIIR